MSFTMNCTHYSKVILKGELISDQMELPVLTVVEALLVVVLAAVLTSETKVDAAPQQTLAQVARDALRDLG